MMRSLFSGVAGLKTHQTKMDVIGNNIANVNTTAYKSSSIVFSDLMSQTTQNASGANAKTGTGGTNARQIGLGVKSGAINVNITGQGSAQSTGNPFDIMITGDNFFVVYDGMSNYFTRDGSFYVDGVGNLAMTSTGYNVMGWGVDPETMEIKQDTVQALRIMSPENMTYPPEATTLATVSGILDKYDVDVSSSAGKILNLNLYDALGYQYTARMVVKQTDNDGEYSVEMTKLLDADGNEVDISGATDILGSNVNAEKSTPVVFNTTGYRWNGTTLQDADSNDLFSLGDLVDSGALKARDAVVQIAGVDSTVQAALDKLADAYGYGGSTEDFLKLYKVTDDTTTPPTTKTVEQSLIDGDFQTVFGAGDFTADGYKAQGGILKFDTDTGLFNNIGGGKTLTMNLSTLENPEGSGRSNFENIIVDFSTIQMFNNNGTSTVTATYGDKDSLGTGRMLGDMIGVSIQRDGRIYASYDNGMTKLLGQIATASFANASGLEKHGDNLYAATMNSGTFDGIGVDVTSNGGYMSTGVLEMSNVDLSSEFTEMITTQRGFQANSRIITVSDTLLEELTNLKR
ncbi:MAG: flagellar hook-basal body complex protein [Lachnospiraceae bacterium]|nr:flagellar hook-basal body complex protein [Lachnospiraceae bacterium]